MEGADGLAIGTDPADEVTEIDSAFDGDDVDRGWTGR
jgi:hypothetical protein